MSNTFAKYQKVGQEELRRLVNSRLSSKRTYSVVPNMELPSGNECTAKPRRCRLERAKATKAAPMLQESLWTKQHRWPTCEQVQMGAETVDVAWMKAKLSTALAAKEALMIGPHSSDIAERLDQEMLNLRRALTEQLAGVQSVIAPSDKAIEPSIGQKGEGYGGPWNCTGQDYPTASWIGRASTRVGHSAGKNCQCLQCQNKHGFSRRQHGRDTDTKHAHTFSWLHSTSGYPWRPQKCVQLQRVYYVNKWTTTWTAQSTYARRHLQLRGPHWKTDDWTGKLPWRLRCWHRSSCRNNTWNAWCRAPATRQAGHELNCLCHIQHHTSRPSPEHRWSHRWFELYRTHDWIGSAVQCCWIRRSGGPGGQSAITLSYTKHVHCFLIFDTIFFTCLTSTCQPLRRSTATSEWRFGWAPILHTRILYSEARSLCGTRDCGHTCVLIWNARACWPCSAVARRTGGKSQHVRWSLRSVTIHGWAHLRWNAGTWRGASTFCCVSCRVTLRRSGHGSLARAVRPWVSERGTRRGHSASAGNTDKQPIVVGKDSVEVSVWSADSAIRICDRNGKQEHPSQNGRCTITVNNYKVRMPRYLDTSTKTQMA